MGLLLIRKIVSHYIYIYHNNYFITECTILYNLIIVKFSGNSFEDIF